MLFLCYYNCKSHQGQGLLVFIKDQVLKTFHVLIQLFQHLLQNHTDGCFLQPACELCCFFLADDRLRHLFELKKKRLPGSSELWLNYYYCVEITCTELHRRHFPICQMCKEWQKPRNWPLKNSFTLLSIAEVP